jgi:hypothetical protein
VVETSSVGPLQEVVEDPMKLVYTVDLFSVLALYSDKNGVQSVFKVGAQDEALTIRLLEKLKAFRRI